MAARSSLYSIHAHSVVCHWKEGRGVFWAQQAGVMTELPVSVLVCVFQM